MKMCVFVCVCVCVVTRRVLGELPDRDTLAKDVMTRHVFDKIVRTWWTAIEGVTMRYVFGETVTARQPRCHVLWQAAKLWQVREAA